MENPDPTRSADDAGKQEPEPQDLIEFLQSSPLAEAIASGELDPSVFERPRDLGREPLNFDWETDA
jgi:hypothetical protein